MKSPVPAVDDRAPLSQYLRAEDEDGWTVFSSDDDSAEVELTTKPERSPDLSVLKRIKNFLSDEAKQEDSFFSNDGDDGAQSFRVDYPFYDANLEEDDHDESSATSAKEPLRDVKGESSGEIESQAKPSATPESVESGSIVPQSPTREEESQKLKEKRAAKARLQFAPVVLQAPKTQPSDEKPSRSSEPIETPTPIEEAAILCESPKESSTPESTVDAAKDVENAEKAVDSVENNEISETTSLENVREEASTEPCEEERFERESSASEEFQPHPLRQIEELEETTNPQTFVVDFSETLAPALERQARGEEFEEPPLVQIPARRSKRAKKESRRLETSENAEASKERSEKTEEESQAFSFDRSRYAPNVRMAIFRRCVDLVSERAKSSDVSATCETEFEPSNSVLEPDASDAPTSWNDAFDYGESVAFVAAPCFSDLGVVASFATTCCASTR